MSHPSHRQYDEGHYCCSIQKMTDRDFCSSYERHAKSETRARIAMMGWDDLIVLEFSLGASESSNSPNTKVT
jgi:hypothetical protein